MRQTLTRALRLLGLGRPGGYWRALAIILALSNLKVLPGIWHVRAGLPRYRARLLHGVFRHLWNKADYLDGKDAGRALFEPAIIRTRAPMGECDYNLHKSNSTYFTDLDVARSHLVAALLKNGINAYNSASKAGETQGRLMIALGAVACTFKREIPPYAPYEIWTRILTWDQKWVYIVSYFVKKGAVRPRHYTIKDERGFLGLGWFGDKAESPVDTPEDMSKAIYACGVSKYVFKSGRKTIPPSQVLERCGLVPEKPADSSLGESLVDVGAELRDGKTPKEQFEEMLDRSMMPEDDNVKWTWERVEQERLKGLQFAKAVATLDSLPETFVGDKVLARFWSIC